MVTKSRLKVFGILAATFVLGGICSAAGYHAFVERKYAELMSGEREAFEKLRLRALAHELDLDGAQQERVQRIFQRHSAEHRRLMRQTFETCGQPVTQLREQIDREIREQLRADQRPRFDTLRAERKRRLFGVVVGTRSDTAPPR